jgi:hypothetical protein
MLLYVIFIFLFLGYAGELRILVFVKAKVKKKKRKNGSCCFFFFSSSLNYDLIEICPANIAENKTNAKENHFLRFRFL